MIEALSVRRVVTGHDAEGRAIITSDDSFPVVEIPSGDAAFCLVWTTETVPADNNDETDGRAREAGLTLNAGSVIRIVDMVSGRASPMHRSVPNSAIIPGCGQWRVNLNACLAILPGPPSTP